MSQCTQSDSGNSSCGNSDSESEIESSSSSSSQLRRESRAPYPFPADVTSICVDVESDRPGDEPPFTSEFNISDYFSTDALSDFDLAVGIVLPNTNNNNCPSSESRTDELEQIGSSRFILSTENSGCFPPPSTRYPQCSASDSVNTNSTNFLISSTSSTSSSLSSSLSSTTLSTSSISHEQSSSSSSSLPHVNRTEQTNKFSKNRQLTNNASSANVAAAASILSKSLTSPTNNKNISGGGGGGAKVLGNLGNGHQNGPLVIHNSNANNLQNSHLPNNQSTIILQTQKQAPSNLLPGIIAQNNKIVSLRQQIPTSGEITLKSSNRSVGDNIASIVGMEAKKNFLYLTAN